MTRHNPRLGIMGDPMQALLAFVWSGHMDGSLLDIGIFLLATFAGALIAGVTGFAFGFVVSALWGPILTPLQTATLVIAFGLIVQGYAVLRLRHALNWGRLWPFILGAAFGVPAGVAVLGWGDPAHVRAATGAFLIVYSIYALLRPTLKPVTNGGAAADAGRRFSQRRARRHDRACRHSRHHLVHFARLAQGRAARGVSAGRRVDFRHERGLARREGRALRRHREAVPDRPAGARARHLARLQALRPPRRGHVPQGGAGAAAGLGGDAGYLSPLSRRTSCAASDTSQAGGPWIDTSSCLV